MMKVRPALCSLHTFCFTLCFTFCLTLWAVGCGGTPAITGRLDEKLVASQIVNDTYLIQVRLPPDYDSQPSRRYPTVYQLDGTSFGPEFNVTAGQASELETAGRIPSTIVVGIGYPYSDPLVSTTMGRGRDYVTRFGDGRPGGADNFLRFVQTELVPQIDALYRTEPSRRILCGHSLGGFVSLHALFTTATANPPPFFAYIAGDPSLDEDNLRLFDEEAALAAQTPALGGSLWIEIARYDGAVQQLSFQLLQARLVAHFPQLRLGSEVLDTDHPGTIAPGFRNGLVHVLGGTR